MTVLVSVLTEPKRVVPIVPKFQSEITNNPSRIYKVGVLKLFCNALMGIKHNLVKNERTEDSRKTVLWKCLSLFSTNERDFEKIT
jgi:hypothetical protein